MAIAGVKNRVKLTKLIAALRDCLRSAVGQSLSVVLRALKRGGA